MVEPIFKSSKEVIRPDKSKKSGEVKSVKFNPFNQKFHSCPYPTYHDLRNLDPVHWSQIGVWVLTRYADIKAVLTDRRFATDSLPQRLGNKSKYVQNNQEGFEVLKQATTKFLFFMNPPDHTRLRGLVSKAFSYAEVEKLRPQIKKTVDELLNEVVQKENIDLIADFAAPLPVIVIAKMLGIPTQDCPMLHEWSTNLSRILDPLLSLQEYQYLNEVVQKFQRYMYDLILEKEKKPKEDLISALISARDRGDKLKPEELSTICVQLFVTGEETTINTIGNGMMALLKHPEQMEKLKQEPAIISSAVEEILRYDSPVQFTGRCATENLEIDGKTIKKDDRVLLVLGAANRDPAQFSHPDRFDITRCDNRHLAFGDGIHYCLGGILARIQAQIAINTLVQSLSNLTLSTERFEWRKNIYLRGLKSLPVTFTP